MELFLSANVNDVFSFCGNVGAGCGENCRFMADFGAVKDVLTLAETAAEQTSQSLDTQVRAQSVGPWMPPSVITLQPGSSCGSAQFVRGQFHMYVISRSISSWSKRSFRHR